jgi:hypothetical protein
MPRFEADRSAPDSFGQDGRGAIRLEPRSAFPLELVAEPVISVLGAGRVTRALMTTAALTGAKERFRIWARSERSGELMRIHLADLPKPDVEVVVSPTPSVDQRGVVILAHGARTSRFSRQKSKQALFDRNLAMIVRDIGMLRNRVVLVLTNPTASIVAALVRQGIHAYGVGVFNDQLRFENDAPPDLRLVGAHNPFELSWGSLSGEPPGEEYSFSRSQYAALLNRQDRFRLMLHTRGIAGRLAGGVADRAWNDIAALHDGTPPARRWYARQRLASRYLENGIAAARATLYAARFFRGTPLDRADVTLEAPLVMPGYDGAILLGWPFDAVTRLPRPLAFTADGAGELRRRAGPYGLPELDHEEAISLSTGGGIGIVCGGQGAASLWRDAFPVAMPGPDRPEPAIRVALSDDPAALTATVDLAGKETERIAQHRGKNPFEHRDLLATDLGDGRRFISFERHGGAAVVNDARRRIDLAAVGKGDLRDEFRKLLRDQIAVPSWLAAGAAVLHAGLLRLEGATLLLVGGSGAGKTTGVLNALSLSAGAYGASERVLVFRGRDGVCALGVPESLTVFPGSLRGLDAFSDLLTGREPASDWLRDAKLRLDRDETLRRLRVEQIGAPTTIDAVVDLDYRADAGAPALASPLTVPEERLAVLTGNDLTDADDVRASWLGWFETQRDPGLFPALGGGAAPVFRIAWQDGAALGRLLVSTAGQIASGIPER